MKSYNVKSNAKRAARKLCGKYDAFEPVEPVAANEPGEWWPAVQFVTPAVVSDSVPFEVATVAAINTPDGKPWMPTSVAAALAEGDAGVYSIPAENMSDLADAEASRCFICNEPIKVGERVLSDISEGVGHRACFGDDREGFVNLETGEPIGPDEPLPEGEIWTKQDERDGAPLAEPETSRGNEVTYMMGEPVPGHLSPKMESDDDCEPRLSPDGIHYIHAHDCKRAIEKGWPREPAPAPRPVPIRDEPAKPKPTAPAPGTLGALLLGPHTKSSAEEIEARRAERRARMDAGEYRQPTEAAKKETKAEVILRMANQEGGATAADIAKACGWQAHTLRGYIGGTLRKRLAVLRKTIEAVKAKGEPTRYVVVTLPAEEDEPDAKPGAA